MSQRPVIDPRTDLILERVIPVSPENVWRAWTEPAQLKEWFAPKPWRVSHCEIELRPGGKFLTVMQSPEGDDMPAESGCFLEVVPNRRLVFTDALGPGFRPSPSSFFTVHILLEPEGEGTRYTAIAMHAEPEEKQQHEDMGFETGWGTALDQLVELARGF